MRHVRGRAGSSNLDVTESTTIMIKQIEIITKYSIALLVLTTIAVSCASQQPGVPASNRTERRLFEETGIAVQGQFLHFYSIYGGQDSLGYPLTEEIVVDGWRVQYFEKGRLEYHPENETAYRVTVGWLGDLLHRRRPSINNPPSDNNNTRYYAETGHSLSGDFLNYFEAHGGTVRFGQPISEPFLLDGKLTQDFQSARFFWTPFNREPVTLEDIGRVHLEAVTAKK